MRILLTGATGFIGAAILARLQAGGHDVVAVTRRKGSAARRLSPARWIELDMIRAVRSQDWAPHLADVDAVVNCAGVLQDGAADSTDAVHRAGPAALFAACEQAGVRRVVQISAIGADSHAATSFSRSKAQGDAFLAASDLDWVILRPSVVVGRSAYGGSALFRALAALPALPAAPGAGELQVVQLDDVAETVARLVEPGAPAGITLELCGPERLSFAAVVASYRRWLGYPRARRTPGALLLPLAFRAGDLAGFLGWRAPIRTTARRELARGSVGDPGPWIEATGLRPRSLGQALATEPASAQDRWFANLYLLKPLVLAVFAAFWIGTALITLGPGFGEAERAMSEAGAGGFSAAGVIGGALVDLAIGLGVAWRRTSRPALWAALAVSAGYLVLGSILAPQLWAAPLGPLTKIVPIMVLNVVALAILEDR